MGSATHGALKAIGMRNPPMAPTAPITPIAAEACLVPASRAAVRSGVPGVVARSASVRQIAGIILYVEPLPTPVAAKTQRKKARNHGNHDWLADAMAGSAVGLGVSCMSVASGLPSSCLVPASGAAVRSGAPGVVARSASVRQIAGIILYVEPLPTPVAAKTQRKKARNHGNHDWLADAMAGSAVGLGVSCMSVQ